MKKNIHPLIIQIHFRLKWFRSFWKILLKKCYPIIRSRNLKKDRQYNGQKINDKKTNDELQNITQKIKD
jgi:hypothetical protein